MFSNCVVIIYKLKINIDEYVRDMLMKNNKINGNKYTHWWKIIKWLYYI